MWSVTASPLRLHISMAASAIWTRHILQTVSVNIQRLISKCWWAFQKHTSEENTPPPKGKPCDAQGILSCTYTRCSKTGWEGWLLHIWERCLHKRKFWHCTLQITALTQDWLTISNTLLADNPGLLVGKVVHCWELSCLEGANISHILPP